LECQPCQSVLPPLPPAGDENLSARLAIQGLSDTEGCQTHEAEIASEVTGDMDQAPDANSNPDTDGRETLDSPSDLNETSRVGHGNNKDGSVDGTSASNQDQQNPISPCNKRIAELGREISGLRAALSADKRPSYKEALVSAIPTKNKFSALAEADTPTDDATESLTSRKVTDKPGTENHGPAAGHRKSERNQPSPFDILAKERISPDSKSLLLGDSVVVGIDPAKMAP
ncbi:hypothetical protein BaRGS_00024018, partial [Batillaria attramentaria]